MTNLSTTQSIDSRGLTAPQAGYKFYQPYYEDYTRRLGSGVFGTPGGVGGLINMPQDIPLQQTAGMTPLMMMARQGLMGASPYTPAYDTSSQLMGEAAGGYRASTGGFNPYTMISPYYDPFESQVVDDTLERMRRTSAQQDIAGRAQDISSGAFGGSRSRLLAKERQRESDRGIMQALAGIRSQGFQSARDAAMAENARRMAAMSGAAGGLGGIAGQVLGLGGQRQQEMMNYLQMMDQFGQGGRNIYETGLGRIQDAAMRRAQEPWERIMKGMGVLQGMRPGELIGGYDTKIYQPQMYQQPTSAGETVQGIGSLLGIGKSIADIYNIFNPTDVAAGGFMEKPKEYNAGGIVSGIVPVNMANGGDASVEQQLKELPPEERQSVLEWIKENPIDAAAMASLAIPVVRWVGARRLGTSAAGRLLFGGKKVKAKTKKIDGKEKVQSKAGDYYDVDSQQGKAILAGKTETTRGLAGRAKDLIMRNKLTSGLLAAAGGSRLFDGGEEEVEEVLIDSDAELERLKEIERVKQEELRAREKSRIFQDIVSTTGRLGEMMNAPGTRQVNLADAANIFAEERMGLPQSDQAKEIEELSRMSGYSPKELMDMTDLYQGKIVNKDDLKAQYINTAFERFGVNFEKHPEHMDMGGSKTGAQIRLEIMNILDMMDTDELTSMMKNLQVPTVIED
jgi:hypothetical protein